MSTMPDTTTVAERIRKRRPKRATPTVLEAKDENGNWVRVGLGQPETHKDTGAAIRWCKENCDAGTYRVVTVKRTFALKPKVIQRSTVADVAD